MIKIRRLREDVKMPTRAHSIDAGLDLYYPGKEMIDIHYGEVRKITLGIEIDIPIGYVGLLKDRSSLAALGLHVLGGVIDSGYRGEVCVVLTCLDGYNNAICIRPGRAICQIVIVPCLCDDVIEISDWDDETSRGSGGFGSTQ